MASDNLHPILKNIQRKLVNIRDDIQSVAGEIKKVRTTIENGIDKILDAINDNIQAQAELKMMDKVARVRSIPAQIDAEKDRVDAEKQELDEKLESIGQRYEQRHQELDEKAEERVRNLGSHIFEIQEAEFERNIERPFHEHITEKWREMQAVNTEMGQKRIERLESGLEETHSSIDDLLHRREQFLSDIERSRVSIDHSWEKPRQVQIPFWVVTVERDGERSQELFAPADLTTRENEYYPITIDERDALRPLIEDVAAKTDPQMQSTQLSTDAVQSVVSQHATGSAAAGQRDFTDALGDVLGDATTIKIEGGAQE
jgi:vacuolar-type H+-ATPase subunit E/Vma4